ncbi:histidine--tRNA ligase [Candidatus Saccharibacteria bacterium]|jgi:histidyl-tRNA synthetase|nr:histidine--tRNA ligase [Candidatus Saccharibacteria bacterium]NCU43844.1 histidine--tRNA ligase [Candidatus Saccharibacteria bacterium]
MKLNTKPLPGMMELLPEEQMEFNRILGVVKAHHAAFGYAEIDTPVIERTETLLAKAGGETEKQIYRFKKGDNDLSLRFDLTVPTARFVAENISHLTFPFKRSQIGKVYRGERSQRGRFREFYQCDIDVIGREKLSLNYDAEVMAVIHAIFKELNLGKFTLRINNRNIMSGLFEGLGVVGSAVELMALIDRAEKISGEDFSRQLKELGIGREAEQMILEFIKIDGESGQVLQRLRDLATTFEKNTRFLGGINELEKVSGVLKQMAVSEDNFKLDMLIVRGLDYYTGTVFETVLDDFKDIGSVASGGRYDNLASSYSKEVLPGVGASIGLTRLFWSLRELGLLKFQQKTPAEYLIVPFTENEVAVALDLANKMRTEGKKVEVLLEEMNIKKAFKFADKRGVKYVVPIGEDKAKSGEFVVQDMITGEKSLL